jgi:hypothetical protein
VVWLNVDEKVMLLFGVCVISVFACHAAKHFQMHWLPEAGIIMLVGTLPF